MPLTQIDCKNAQPQEKPYKKTDGQGMYLEIMPNGSKYWRMKYRFAGKEKRLAIGVYPDVSLAEAREARTQAKTLLKENKDPSQEKQKARQQVFKDAEHTFQSIAEQWYARHRQTWKDAHAVKIWRRIEMHVFPFLGKYPISTITPKDIIKCVQRIEDSGAHDIAKRAYQNIKRILDYAVIEEITDRNVALHIKPKDILLRQEVKHNPHLEEHELPDYLRAVDNFVGEKQTKLALKLMMLVFIRHTELREARWDEFIFDRSEWRIPAERMKMNKPHVVPLSRQSMEILKELKNINGIFDYVFPQKRNPRKVMSDGTMTRALYRMGYKGRLTVHGMRGTASTILNEHGFNPDAIEAQQSRQDTNKVRASYNHAQYLDERRQMMQWWADHLDKLKQV